MKRLALGIAFLSCAAANAQPIEILFVGNSYTFARVAPMLNYNAANVTDLTRPRGPLHGGTDPALPFVSGAPFTNLTGTNSYPVGTINPATGNEFTSFSPHTQTNTWGGVPGIFKQFTQQAGLNYNVSLSTRNAASLRGHFLNTANDNWNLRGNISSQRWDKVVLQEQSDEVMPPRISSTGTPLASNFPAAQAYTNLIENWIHGGAALSYRERAMYNTIHGNQDGCVSAGGTAASCNNNTLRTIEANPNANAAAKIFLQQVWARPNMVNPPGTTTINPRTGEATYDPASPAPTFYASLEAATADIKAGNERIAAFAGADGSGGIAGIAPVGEAFMRAIRMGVATPDMYAPDALSDGLLDLWFNDGTHPSVHGAYLSALTLFGTITGLDPRTLGALEQAARDLGIDPLDAMRLQQVAADQLGFAVVPIPGSLPLFVAGLAALALVRRRRGQGRT
jgi:hypothetical protein